MFCTNCGRKLNPGDTFCTGCGCSVKSEETLNENNLVNAFNNNQNLINNDFNMNQGVNMEVKNDSKKKISLIMGIISLVIVFLVPILCVPFAIVGIIFGILALKENKKYKAGLILSIVSLLLILPVALTTNYIVDMIMGNEISGTWNCSVFPVGEDSEYIVTLKINRDKFLWGEYGDILDNHVIGSYEFKDLHKTNSSGEFKYYSLKVEGEEYVVNGELRNKRYYSSYEIALKEDKAVLMNNAGTGSMYLCYRVDSSLPDIEKTY